MDALFSMGQGAGASGASDLIGSAANSPMTGASVGGAGGGMGGGGGMGAGGIMSMLPNLGGSASKPVTSTAATAAPTIAPATPIGGSDVGATPMSSPTDNSIRMTDFLGQRYVDDPYSKEGQMLGGTAGSLIGSIWGPIGSMIGKRAGTDVGGTIQDLATLKNPWPTLFHRFITNPLAKPMG